MEKTLILNSGKCSWGKCIACGWGKLDAGQPVIGKLVQQVQNMDVRNCRLKVFASGSFFDDAQFPPEFRKWFADFVREQAVKELVVESRPEFITKKNLADFSGINLVVAIGLESSSDIILEKYRKGFAVSDYVKAAQLLKKMKIRLRTYIMVNMPHSAQKDLDDSAKFALKYSDSVVLINTFPHAKAELFDLWISGKWKPYDKGQFDAAVKKWAKNKKVESDFNNYQFVPKFPREKRTLLRGVSEEYLSHPYYEVWQDYFSRFYEKPAGKTIALFLPCSFKKPYPESQTHQAIAGVLRQNKRFAEIHRLVISSPGIIPLEFSNYYPFNAYDWEEWKEYPELMKKYVEVNKKRIKNYLSTHKYKKYYAYMKPDSESFAALSGACKELKIKLVSLIDEKTYEKVKAEKSAITGSLLLKNLEKIK